jgi:3-oxoadipate enol-lactonase
MGTLRVNGARVVVSDHGSGPPLVLVHGLGATAAGLWRKQLGPFAEDFRVIAYDLRGSGGSDVTPGPYTIEGLADDLAALVEALELGRIAVMGHSLGGSIALAYAAAHPDAVVGLVGLGAPTTLPDAGREGLAKRAATVEAEGMAAVVATVAGNGVSPTFRENAPDEFQRFIELLESNDPHGYAAQCRALVGLDLSGALQQITAPVLLLAGDRDGVAPPAATQANAAAIGSASAAIVEDCGHILPWERPGALAAAARPFLLEHAS